LWLPPVALIIVPAFPPFAELDPLIEASALPVVIDELASPWALASADCVAATCATTRLPIAAAMPLSALDVELLEPVVCVPVLVAVCVLVPPVCVLLGSPPVAVASVLAVFASADPTTISASALHVIATRPTRISGCDALMLVLSCLSVDYRP
jgi:hypothetical protein